MSLGPFLCEPPDVCYSSQLFSAVVGAEPNASDPVIIAELVPFAYQLHFVHLNRLGSLTTREQPANSAGIFHDFYRFHAIWPVILYVLQVVSPF
jgi:hypothetical protein